MPTSAGPGPSDDRDKLVRLSREDARAAVRLLSILVDAEGDVAGSGPGGAEPVPRTPAQERIRLSRKASRILYERQRRGNHFNPVIFGEPAWDMLLALYISDTAQRQLSIGRLVDWIAVPSTTALRWLDYLEERKYVARRPHPTDGRVVFVDLLDKGREAVSDYLRDILSGS